MPDLCNVQAILSLVLVGELLSFALVVADIGVTHFSWLRFGMVSFLVLWITLCSAACLCPLRSWLKGHNSVLAGTICYAIVLGFTVIFSLGGEWFQTGDLFQNINQLLSNLCIAAVFAGVALRYFYIQQQLSNQQQAELLARIQSLQSRIRPHFLFNSMNAIASLITIDPVVAEKMIVNLAHLFRASLDQPGLVTFNHEIELCEKFVEMEKLRFGKRLDMHWKVENIPEDATIPSLLVQPLLENAIYHGIQPILGGGKIEFNADSNGKQIRFEIINPVGNPSEAHSEYKGNGIALENIRHRLMAYYGTHASLKTEQENDTFKVSVRYPLVQSPIRH